MKDLMKEHLIAEVTLSPEGIIELTLEGNASSDLHAAELTAWVEKAKAAILEQKQKTGKAMTISYIAKLNNFDEGSVEIINSLAGWPEARDVKSAVVGANMITNMALRTITTVSGRTNLKSFNEKDAAIAWLKSDV